MRHKKKLQEEKWGKGITHNDRDSSNFVFLQMQGQLTMRKNSFENYSGTTILCMKMAEYIKYNMHGYEKKSGKGKGGGGGGANLRNDGQFRGMKV